VISMLQTVAKNVSYIKNTYQYLSQTNDLSPHNEEVNKRLADFVSTLSLLQGKDIGQELLMTPELSEERNKLPGLCALAECEMEKFWTKRLLKNKALKNGGLRDFWYFDHYKNLCDAEWALTDIKSYDSVSFLGSGALPLTAYFATQKCPEAEIKCVDCDCNACDLAVDLVDALGLSNRIEIIQSYATDYKPGDRELVICASLLTDRPDLYQALNKNDVSSLLIRDAEDIYQFLYKAAETPDSNFEFIRKTKPTPERINTSLFYQRKVA